MKQNSNIRDVAKLAQVSAMTVTRAFSGKGSITKATREKIMEAAQALDYRPNLFARKLSGGSTNSVGILWSMAPPHHSVRQVRGISIRMYKRGYACHVADSLSDSKIIKQCLEEFIDHRVDAVILQDITTVKDADVIIGLLKKLPACIMVTNELRPELPFDQLVVEESRAVQDILKDFAAAGKKNPAYFFGHTSRKCQLFLNELKAQGFTGGKKNLLNIQVIPHMTNEYNWNAFAEYLHENYPDEIPFDAFLVSADENAAALIRYLETRGLRVPDDIAICGFNNSYMSEFAVPPIASVSHEEEKVADIVDEMFAHRISNPQSVRQVRTSFMKYIPRESAGNKTRR